MEDRRWRLKAGDLLPGTQHLLGAPRSEPRGPRCHATRLATEGSAPVAGRITASRPRSA